MRFIHFLFIFGCMFSPLGAQPASELAAKLQSMTENKQVLYKKVAGQLRCPTCTGLSVMQSDAPFSQQIKNAVIDQVIDGQNEDQILQFFTERYGLWIRREPPKEGVHLLAWLLPLLLLVGGPLVLWRVYWRRSLSFDREGMRSDEEILIEMHESLKLIERKQ